MLLFLLVLALPWEPTHLGSCTPPRDLGVSDDGLFAWAMQGYGYDSYDIYYRSSNESSFAKIDLGYLQKCTEPPLPGPGWLLYCGVKWFTNSHGETPVLAIIDVSPDMSYYLSIDGWSSEGFVATSFWANNTKAMDLNVSGTTEFLRVTNDGSICQGFRGPYMKCTSFPDRIVSTIYPPTVPANYTVTSYHVVWTPLGYQYLSFLTSTVHFPFAFVRYDNAVFRANLENLSPIEKSRFGVSNPIEHLSFTNAAMTLVDFMSGSAAVVTPYLDGYLFYNVSARGQQAIFLQFQSKDPSHCPVTLVEVRPMSAGPYHRECECSDECNNDDDSSSNSAKFDVLNQVLTIVLLLMISFMSVVSVVMYFQYRKSRKREAGENDEGMEFLASGQ